MGVFSAKIRELHKLSGKPRDHTPKLILEITPQAQLRASVSKRGIFGGTWERSGKFFAGAVKPLAALYRFLSSAVHIRSDYTTPMLSADAIEMHTDTDIEEAATAPVLAKDTADILAVSSVRLSIAAKLVSYARANARYIKSVLLARKAALQTAHSAVAAYRKHVPTVVRFAAAAADSAIMESRWSEVKASVQTAATATPAVNACNNAKLTDEYVLAAAAGAPSFAAETQTAVAVTCCAKVTAWIEPVLENGILTIRQAYSAVQTDDVLEVI